MTTVSAAGSQSPTTARVSSERSRAFAAGARAMAPWLLGTTPFGLVIGVSAAQSDLPAVAGWLTGPLIFAGSAQVATINLIDAGAAPVIVVLAALAINARLVLYSAAMAPHWNGTSPWWQAIAAYGLVEPSLAVGTAGYEQEQTREAAHMHYLGAAVVLWLGWVGAISAGVALGSTLPAALRLEFVIPLFLVGEVIPRLTTNAARRAVTVTAAAAVGGTFLPLHLGPLVAIIAGTTVALVHKEEQ